MSGGIWIILDHFGTILCHFGTILGPFWDHFGTILEPFWTAPFWGNFGHFRPWAVAILDYVGNHCGVFLDDFGTILGTPARLCFVGSEPGSLGLGLGSSGMLGSNVT